MSTWSNTCPHNYTGWSHGTQPTTHKGMYPFLAFVTWPPQGPQHLPLHLSSSSTRVLPHPRAPHVSTTPDKQTSLNFPNSPIPFSISRNYPHPNPLSFSSYVTVVLRWEVPLLNRPPEFRHVEVTNITFQWSELAVLDTCRGTDAPRTLSLSLRSTIFKLSLSLPFKALTFSLSSTSSLS